MSFLSTVVWYSKPNRSNNLTKSIAFIICLLQKWNYFSTLGFKYFEFLFMYERMLNWIWIFSMFVLALKCIDSPKILCIRYLLPSGVWEYHRYLIDHLPTYLLVHFFWCMLVRTLTTVLAQQATPLPSEYTRLIMTACLLCNGYKC